MVSVDVKHHVYFIKSKHVLDGNLYCKYSPILELFQGLPARLDCLLATKHNYISISI